MTIEPFAGVKFLSVDPAAGAPLQSAVPGTLTPSAAKAFPEVLSGLTEMGPVQPEQTQLADGLEVAELSETLATRQRQTGASPTGAEPFGAEAIPDAKPADSDPKVATPNAPAPNETDQSRWMRRVPDLPSPAQQWPVAPAPSEDPAMGGVTGSPARDVIAQVPPAEPKRQSAPALADLPAAIGQSGPVKASSVRREAVTVEQPDIKRGNPPGLPVAGEFPVARNLPSGAGHSEAPPAQQDHPAQGKTGPKVLAADIDTAAMRGPQPAADLPARTQADHVAGAHSASSAPQAIQSPNPDGPSPGGPPKNEVSPPSAGLAEAFAPPGRDRQDRPWTDRNRPAEIYRAAPPPARTPGQDSAVSGLKAGVSLRPVSDRPGWGDPLVLEDVAGPGTAGTVRSAAAPAPSVAPPGSPVLPNVLSQVALAAPIDLSRQQVELALEPVELGRVRMRLAQVDGAMTLVITAERPETLDLMRRHSGELAAELSNVGFGQVNLSFSGSDSTWQDAEMADEAFANRREEHALPSVADTPILHLSPDGDRLDMRL